MRTPTLSVSRLQKRIQGRFIVQDVSFHVHPGQILGFLGPNGAGKTTTIRMLVGLIRPTNGTIRINGIDLLEHAPRALRNVGCIVENPDLYPYLTGYENLYQLASMQGKEAVSRITEVADLVHLTHRLDEKVSTYSLGMRQRLGIAQALLGRPSLLILDEPTNGLDPAGIRELRTFLQSLAADGLSILISSHLLSEVEQLCTHVAMIQNGVVFQTGSIDQLLTSAEPKIKWSVTPTELAQEILCPFSSDGRVSVVDHTLNCLMDSGQVPSATAALVQAGCDVHEVTPVRWTLEDVFLEATGGERNRDDPASHRQ